MKSRESSETGCYRDAIHLFMQRSLKLKQLVLRANVQQFYQICLRNVEIMLNQSPFNAFSARISIVSSTGTLVKSEETSHVRMRQDAAIINLDVLQMFCISIEVETSSNFMLVFIFKCVPKELFIKRTKNKIFEISKLTRREICSMDHLKALVF